MEKLLIEFHDFFSRPRLDIGGNMEFKIKLTAEPDKPLYSQGPPTPIHLSEDPLVEHALMQYYGIVTTLQYSKYCIPLFAQRKPSSALRLWIDLRRVNHLIRHDYDSHIFTVTTLVSGHIAGKKIFAQLDCSQACFALRMADPLSVQLLSFNVFSKTFAFTRLAQDQTIYWCVLFIYAQVFRCRFCEK